MNYNPHPSWTKMHHMRLLVCHFQNFLPLFSFLPFSISHNSLSQFLQWQGQQISLFFFFFNEPQAIQPSPAIDKTASKWLYLILVWKHSSKNWSSTSLEWIVTTFLVWHSMHITFILFRWVMFLGPHLATTAISHIYCIDCEGDQNINESLQYVYCYFHLYSHQ